MPCHAWIDMEEMGLKETRSRGMNNSMPALDDASTDLGTSLTSPFNF